MLKKLQYFFSMMWILLAAFLAGGCSDTNVLLMHNTIYPISNKRQGNILLQQFTDKRMTKPQIGNIENMWGMTLAHINVDGRARMEERLPIYFANAFREAGYTAVVQGTEPVDTSKHPVYDAIVEGDITEFWITNDIEARARISIFIRAIDPDSRRVVWERDYRASKSNLLLYATQGEFEDIISQTLGIMLNQAAQEFASDSFYKPAIQKVIPEKKK